MLSKKTNLFQGHYCINNKTYARISFSNLLSVAIEKPGIQRLKDPDKIKEIIDYQESFFKKNKHFNILGTINIHCCLEDQKNYLTDGQHRYESIKQLATMYRGEENHVSIEIVDIDTKEEYETNYKLINKNTPLPEFSETIDKNIVETCFVYFENKYKGIWKPTLRPNRPYLNKNHFQEAISILIDELLKHGHNLSSEEITDLIESKNDSMKKWSFKKFGGYRRITGDPTKLKEKCENCGGCFLGMLPHNSDNGYDWVRQIVQEKTGIEMDKVKKAKSSKKSIPKKRKLEVWYEYIGKDKGEHECLCCRKEKINQGGNWEAGHVISTHNLLNENKTDDISVDNLRPICSSCNKGMGKRNMKEYMEELYPQNVQYLFKKSKWFGGMFSSS